MTHDLSAAAAYLDSEISFMSFKNLAGGNP